MDGEISKKQLLEATGISYGQLYRWKREGLIPDEWFIKRTAFTGQETFFPAEKILPRVRTILQLKDTMSLEEIAKRLSPELSERLFTLEEVHVFEEIGSDPLLAYGLALKRFRFSFQDILLLCALSEYCAQHPVDLERLKQLSVGMGPWAEQFTDAARNVLFIEKQGDVAVLLEDATAPVLLDDRWTLALHVSLERLSAALRLKYTDEFISDAEG